MVTRTIPALLRRAVDQVPDKTWLLTTDGRLTYAEAFGRVTAAAAWLSAHGVRRRDRVVVTARNTADYVMAWLAVVELGAVAVAVNPAGTADETTALVRQVSPRLVVSDGDALQTLAGDSDDSPAGPGPTVVEVGALFDEPDDAPGVPAGADGTGRGAVSPDDVAVMIPTSGTSGRSKLVMQTHRSYVLGGEGFPYWMGLGADDRLLTALPLFHVNAQVYSVLGSLAARASLAILEDFSARGFLDAARRFDATEFNAIGAMLEILMRQPERPDDADNPLRICYTGPSPSRRRHVQIEERFGIEIVCGYGLSETPYGLIWPHGTRPYGTLGAPRQHPELGHMNDARVTDDGRPVADGEVGELELRNDAVMVGYYEMPQETAAVMVDGWLRTGDLVRVNGDGTYTFVGRRKQVIRRRGENLSPLEVEEVLESHEAVAEAAVIGVPSELSEQDVKAFVVGVPDRRLDLTELHRHAAARLARFKVPRYYETVASLPHTPTGRLASHQLPETRTAEEIDMESFDTAEDNP